MKQENTPSKNKKYFSLLGLLFGLVGGGWETYSVMIAIERSTNSTAAIGYLFLPLDFVIAFVPYYVSGFCFERIWLWWKCPPRKINITILVFILISFVLTAFKFNEIHTSALLIPAVSEVQKMTTDKELRSAFETSTVRNNKFFLGVIAQHPSASAELLDDISKLSDPELHERMGTSDPVMGQNKKGLAVMRLVLRHPNVSAKTVEYLASHSSVDYVLGDAAQNRKASVDTLRQLELKHERLIDYGLATNKNTPEDVFVKILERAELASKSNSFDGYMIEAIMKNPSASNSIQERASKLKASRSSSQ